MTEKKIAQDYFYVFCFSLALVYLFILLVSPKSRSVGNMTVHCEMRASTAYG